MFTVLYVCNVECLYFAFLCALYARGFCKNRWRQKKEEIKLEERRQFLIYWSNSMAVWKQLKEILLE